MVLVTDPVCKMEIDPKTAAGKSDFDGKTYYFCSAGCKREFDKDPGRYLGKTSGTSYEHHH
jgi:P-type Cu+ transporter